MFQFMKLIDPSTTLGAFIISMSASFLVGFFTSKSISKKKNVQKARDVNGDMIQDSKMEVIKIDKNK